MEYIDRLVQGRRNSSAFEMELRFSGINPLVYVIICTLSVTAFEAHVINT